MQLPIYLDNNATTQTDSRVVEAMLPYFTEFFGNAASTSHSFGRTARQAVQQARISLARSIGANAPDEIIFTSGATESDNLAIKGVAMRFAEKGRHLITVQTEHKAVLDTCRYLQGMGFSVTFMEVGRDGLVDLDALADAITDETILVSIMAANNEVGVLQDISTIGRICREKGVLFHTDATQAAGKIPFDVQAMNVDLASFSAHKIYGPKGVGALYIRNDPSVRLSEQMHGGAHECGCRSGTLNVTGIVGFARALELCLAEIEGETQRLVYLRDKLKNGLRNALDSVSVNGHETQRLPGHLNLTFPSITGESLMMNMPEIAVSTVSACSSASGSPSHVLKAMGVEDSLARSSVRFGIGRFNTEEQIDYTITRVTETVARLSKGNPIPV